MLLQNLLWRFSVELNELKRNLKDSKIFSRNNLLKYPAVQVITCTAEISVQVITCTAKVVHFTTCTRGLYNLYRSSCTSYNLHNMTTCT